MSIKEYLIIRIKPNASQSLMIMDFPTVNFQLGSSDIFVKNGACDSTDGM